MSKNNLCRKGAGMWAIFFLLGIRPFLIAAQEPSPLFLLTAKGKLQIDPNTLAIKLIAKNNKVYTLSAAAEKQTVSSLTVDSTKISWTWPAMGRSVQLQMFTNYLSVSISSADTASFCWPRIAGADTYSIPLHQGKRIPAGDKKWIAYLSATGPYSGSQNLSMQFLTADFKDLSILYIFRNIFNNQIRFSEKSGKLAIDFTHEFPATVKDKQYGFRIYFTHNDPVDITNTYKRYIQERHQFVSLEEKASANQNIRKLYGAPHIYIWNTRFLVEKDIVNWTAFRDFFGRQLLSPEANPSRHLVSLFSGPAANPLSRLQHKDTFFSQLNAAMERADFYDAEAWKGQSLTDEAVRLLQKGVQTLTAAERDALNKSVFFTAYADYLLPPAEWGAFPESLIAKMQHAGIRNAWLGLGDGWAQAEKHPEPVTRAVAAGYLIGPYDSYHSMHPPGKARWITADFTDTSLYTHAFVMNKDGKPNGGFLGAGRHLNPILSFPAVEERVNRVMAETGDQLNSWFIDCDATGEIYDDYTPERMTSQEQDLGARLQRMNWIRDRFKLVIGSEDGNDLASGSIAFAHGMLIPFIGGADKDMRSDKRSPYFAGDHFSMKEDIPEIYVKQVPLKPEYTYVYFDSRFDVPLYQLVYNNSVISTHHWAWPDFKVPAETKHTALKEILYNVPPMYHLNDFYWKRDSAAIVNQLRIFAPMHTLAITQEMTGFDWLTPDHLVQKTSFGQALKIVANFSGQPFFWQKKKIAAHSVAVYYVGEGRYVLYTP